jgi:hypothetical protein
MDAFEILVVILSITLAIFLVLAITIAVLVIKLVQSLRLVVAKGEHLVDSAEEIGETIRRNAGAVGLARVLMNIMNAVNKAKKG